MRTRDAAAKRFEGGQGIQKSRESILQGSVGKENLRAWTSRCLREELLLLSLHVTPNVTLLSITTFIPLPSMFPLSAGS